jgi:hypothetical protein
MASWEALANHSASNEGNFVGSFNLKSPVSPVCEGCALQLLQPQHRSMSFQDMKKRFEPPRDSGGSGGTSPRPSTPSPPLKAPEGPSKRALPPRPSPQALADGTRSLGRMSTAKTRPNLSIVPPSAAHPEPVPLGTGGLSSPPREGQRTPPPRPPKARGEGGLGRSSDLPLTAAERRWAEREQQLEKKILELQVRTLRIVDTHL